MLGEPSGCLGQRVGETCTATDRNTSFAQDEILERLQVRAQLGRVIFRHLAEELVDAVLNEVEDHLGLPHLVHDMMRYLVIQMMVDINNSDMVLLKEPRDLKERIAAFETDGFGLLVQRQDNPTVVAIVIGNYDRRSLQFRP